MPPERLPRTGAGWFRGRGGGGGGEKQEKLLLLLFLPLLLRPGFENKKKIWVMRRQAGGDRGRGRTGAGP
jgi:hypothetical protein